jgi:hypothetical protein
MLDQFLFGLHDREVQLKLFDIGPTLTTDQAISTARTCETSKLLAEQQSEHQYKESSQSRCTRNRSPPKSQQQQP